MVQNRKNDIIDAATELFAKYGYDASGMDEISKTAGVPKSLLYYHFKNKEELLNYIIDAFIEKYRLLMQNNKHGISKITDYVEMLKENKRAVKIILSESLKEKRSDLLFRTLFVITQRIDAESYDVFKDKKAKDEHLLAEFFTSIIPTLYFACIQDDWCNFFDVTLANSEKSFAKVYEQTHGAYHKSIDRESY